MIIEIDPSMDRKLDRINSHIHGRNNIILGKVSTTIGECSSLTEWFSGVEK